MKGPITIDAGADVKQSEDVGLKTRQNKNVSVAAIWLEGNGRNNSQLIDRIQQIGSKKSSNKSPKRIKLLSYRIEYNWKY